MARFAIGGFQHETNTFAPVKASFRDFEIADGWPGLTRGEAMLTAFAGINLPVAGFIDAARKQGHELLPTLWCSASPSAEVRTDAFEKIVGELLQRIGALGKIDGIYLDLHGAMVTEDHQDGEGELLERLRKQIGAELPIVVSLDLHANITERMIKHASTLVVCRTYPHVDLAEAGEASAVVLDCLTRQGPLFKAIRRTEFLVPLISQCTLIEPASGIYRAVAEAEQGDVVSASFAFGFPPADIAECGPAIVTYGTSQRAADEAADRLLALVNAKEAAFAGKIWKPDEAVSYARAKGNSATKPIVLADTQDNPGAGGTSDTVGLLRALIDGRAEGVVFANLCDPKSAEAAHRAGVGAQVSLAIGGWAGGAGNTPYEGTFTVEALGDGNFPATGPFYRGNRMQLGPMAVLKKDGVRVVLCSRKQQCADQAMLRHVGIEPSAQKILALKSSVHFRADFQPIAEEILIVAAPGTNPVDNRDLPYKRIRKGIRLMPLAEPFKG
ncbi:M81 family metallopeptidase [Dongia deserti]|uniref:M81 family metallopeptidase n=1 Tax=Dongia deserti TaxID=2268030 RepID=UPI000E64EC62|nr:M81 family metallopeptidase [Dongia deserti]